MKRTAAAIVIIAVIILGGTSACLCIDGVLREMDVELAHAYSQAQLGDLDGALGALGRFNEIFEDNKILLFVFLKRELLYNLMSDSGTISSYADEDNPSDFFAEINKARRHIDIIGDSLFGPF